MMSSTYGISTPWNQSPGYNLLNAKANDPGECRRDKNGIPLALATLDGITLRVTPAHPPPCRPGTTCGAARCTPMLILSKMSPASRQQVSFTGLRQGAIAHEDQAFQLIQLVP